MHVDYARTAVVVPSINEPGETVAWLVGAIVAALPGAQVYIADDSRHEHFDRFSRELAAALPGASPVLIERRACGFSAGGLGGAVRYAFARAKADGMRYAVVLDADGQHPPEVLPRLLAPLREPGDCDIVLGTRRTDGGSDGSGLTPARRVLSLVSATAARLAFPRSVGSCSDPMSGLFAVRLAAVRPFWSSGFKVLVHLLAQQPELRRAEVGYSFRPRAGGVSKAGLDRGIEYLGGLGYLRWCGWLGRPAAAVDLDDVVAGAGSAATVPDPVAAATGQPLIPAPRPAPARQDAVPGTAPTPAVEPGQ